MGRGCGCAPETPSLTPDVESNSFTVISFQEETGTPNGPFGLAICDTETTGLGMECEIIQLSCLVQGKAPFNQYLLPDKKMISESETKIHGHGTKNWINGTFDTSQKLSQIWYWL